MFNQVLAVLSVLAVTALADDLYPPINDEFRCLEQGRQSQKWTMQDVIEAFDLRQDDCPAVTDEICLAPDYYPYPCNCHAYVRCVPTEIPGYYIPCIYECVPYDLIFDPNTGSCEYPDQAPPGLCADTPDPTFTPPATDDTTTPRMTTTEAKTTTTEARTTTTEARTTTTEARTTTTEARTTTTEARTTTTEARTTTTAEPTTTPIPPDADDCEYDNQTYPYPGDCHKYYQCIPVDGGYEVYVFDCEGLVYDPNTGSCQFPEGPDDLLCGDEGLLLQ